MRLLDGSWVTLQRDKRQAFKEKYELIFNLLLKVGGVSRHLEALNERSESLACLIQVKKLFRGRRSDASVPYAVERGVGLRRRRARSEYYIYLMLHHTRFRGGEICKCSRVQLLATT